MGCEENRTNEENFPWDKRMDRQDRTFHCASFFYFFSFFVSSSFFLSLFSLFFLYSLLFIYMCVIMISLTIVCTCSSGSVGKGAAAIRFSLGPYSPTISAENLHFIFLILAYRWQMHWPGEITLEEFWNFKLSDCFDLSLLLCTSWMIVLVFFLLGLYYQIEVIISFKGHSPPLLKPLMDRIFLCIVNTWWIIFWRMNFCNISFCHFWICCCSTGANIEAEDAARMSSIFV